MAKFNYFNIYDMYATARTNYLAVANDPIAPTIIVPQVKAQTNTFTRRFPQRMINDFSKVTRNNGRAFMDASMEFVANIISDSRKIPSAPVNLEEMILENITDISIDLGISDFLKMEASTQSVFRNFNIVDPTPKTDIPSAIFTQQERSPLDYKESKMPVYSGVDINIVFMTPHVLVKSDVIKTLSFSTHMEANEVRTLGRSYPKGYTDSPRTIAGSMIGTLSVNDPLMQLHPEWFDGEINKSVPFQDLFKPYLLTDQLPLFDILVIFQNEYGYMSAFTIFGVKIPDHGIVMSVDDSVIEVTYQYKAMDVEVIHEVVTKTDPETGLKQIDILHNDEYILKHNMVLSGQSLHRSILDVPYLWDEMWDNIEEIRYLKKLVPPEKFGLLLGRDGI
jgi:hypothetical protein